MTSINLDAPVSLDSPDYDLDGHPLTQPVPSLGAGGWVKKKRQIVRTSRADCVFDGGGTFTITEVRTERHESDDEVLLLLL